MAVGCDHSASVMEQRIVALQAGSTTVPWVGHYESVEGILSAGSAADIGMAVVGH
jgi:hypothetical protein